MQEIKDRIIVNEDGVFIPRQLFGQKDQILDELDQAGVFAPPSEEPEVRPPAERPKIRRVEPIDLSRELRWLKEHRHEYVGQWVALDGDRLVAHGPDPREVYQAARQAGIASPFVEQILPTDDLPFGGW